MVRCAVIILVLAASPAAAQIQSRPTDPPSVTATNETWYQLREPIMFAGDLYYRAGAAVFFDGNTMVRSGYYNGVPLYTDTTIEPYSVVLVPIRPGVMQPYERLRRGGMASTTGSRTPSFPVRITADAAAVPTTTTMVQPRPLGAIPASEVISSIRQSPPAETVSAQSNGLARRVDAPIVSLVKPESNDGVWIHYQGTKWLSAGPAVPLRSTEFRAVGQYEGFPVFVRLDDEKTIYLPTRAGLVAPYRAK